MKRRAALAGGLTLLLTRCKPPQETSLKVIVGAILIDGSGDTPLSRSVVIVAGSRILVVGPQSSVPIPAGSEKFNGGGKFLIAAPVEIGAAAQIPEVKTIAEARQLIEGGANAFAGMVEDSAALDEPFLLRLRHLRAVCVPRLHRLAGPVLAQAQDKVRQLAAAGVAVASGGVEREHQLLRQAGLSPAEVILSATRHSAAAIGKAAEQGAVASGMRADLWLLEANPLEDSANLGKVSRIMMGGEWVK